MSYDFLQNIIKNHNFVVIIAYDFNEKNIIKYYEMGINLCINFEENFIQIYNKIIEKVLKYEDMPILKYKQLIIYKDFSFYYNDTQVFFSELEKKILFLFIKRHDCIISKEELLLYLKYFERESFDKYISNLIARINQHLDKIKCSIHIYNVRGKGYMITANF